MQWTDTEKSAFVQHKPIVCNFDKCNEPFIFYAVR
jgi:hypothetical protein